MEITTIQSSNPEINGVPRTGLQSNHTATGGVCPANVDVGGVFCLLQFFTIEEEEDYVPTPGLHFGLHAEVHPPGS